MTHAGGYSADPRIRWIEWTPFVAAIACFFLLPEYVPLGARILIYILYALSLDLILGYAGIVTLGHSAFFGVGAYVAGILGRQARHHRSARCSSPPRRSRPALLGVATGAVILRTTGLTLLMLTLAIASLCLEIANQATPITGGADGLSGIVVAPILGLFRFDMFGKTGYVYCLVMLFVGWFVVRRLIYSPFGASLAGHPGEQPAHARDRRPGLSAAGDGLRDFGRHRGRRRARSLTQTNQFVGLNVLGFEAAGELLVMLILGGVGRIYGAFVGPIVFLIAQD